MTNKMVPPWFFVMALVAMLVVSAPSIEARLGTLNFSLCVERVFGGGQPKATFLPVPGHDDLMMISDLEGLVNLYRVDNSATGTKFVVVGTVLDIRSKVVFRGELGLLGAALHKNFASNGRLYVSFSCSGRSAGIGCNAQDSVIDEYTVFDPSDPSKLQANITSRRRIFRIPQPSSNHKGGQILFSPDPSEPHLFFMLGDGGGEGDPNNRAQPLKTPYGKVLRMNVDATFASRGTAVVPKDNPFVKVKGANGFVWANGFRNPWRCSFDRPTFRLYCGDVGQGRMEEADIITKGANYGWSKYEGTLIFNRRRILRGAPAVTFPIIEYLHSDLGSGFAAVIGGYIVHSNRDSRLTGKYLFGDLSGPILLAEENNGKWTAAKVGIQCSTNSPLSCNIPTSIVSFGEMTNGDILLGDDSGGVFRFVAGSNCNQTPKPCRRLSRAACRSRSDCRVRGKRCVVRSG